MTAPLPRHRITWRNVFSAIDIEGPVHAEQLSAQLAYYQHYISAGVDSDFLQSTAARERIWLCVETMIAARRLWALRVGRHVVLVPATDVSELRDERGEGE